MTDKMLSNSNDNKNDKMNQINDKMPSNVTDKMIQSGINKLNYSIDKSGSNDSSGNLRSEVNYLVDLEEKKDVILANKT